MSEQSTALDLNPSWETLHQELSDLQVPRFFADELLQELRDKCDRWQQRRINNVNARDQDDELHHFYAFWLTAAFLGCVNLHALPADDILRANLPLASSRNDGNFYPRFHTVTRLRWIWGPDFWFKLRDCDPPVLLPATPGKTFLEELTAIAGLRTVQGFAKDFSAWLPDHIPRHKYSRRDVDLLARKERIVQLQDLRSFLDHINSSSLFQIPHVEPVVDPTKRTLRSKAQRPTVTRTAQGRFAPSRRRQPVQRSASPEIGRRRPDSLALAHTPARSTLSTAQSLLQSPLSTPSTPYRSSRETSHRSRSKCSPSRKPGPLLARLSKLAVAAYPLASYRGKEGFASYNWAWASVTAGHRGRGRLLCRAG
jgi:hypothetical protein